MELQGHANKWKERSPLAPFPGPTKETASDGLTWVRKSHLEGVLEYILNFRKAVLSLLVTEMFLERLRPVDVSIKRTVQCRILSNI